MEEYIVDLESKKYILTTYMIERLGYSSRQTKLLLKGKRVLINNKYGYWDSKLKNNDRVVINNDEKPSEDILPQNIPIEILYEDEYLLAVNKPPFMLVHPTPNHKVDTLANALSYYYRENSYDNNIRFLNRLDMNTSGIVIVPKTPEIHSELTKMMEANKIDKYYLAVIEGNMKPMYGTIDKPIGKDPCNHIKRAVTDDGQTAVTIYSTINDYENAALLKLQLMTGRTHQIRVHMSYSGHPLIGDSLYGMESKLIKRQALHSHRFIFRHPISDKILDIKSDMPEDMSELIELLRR